MADRELSLSSRLSFGDTNFDVEDRNESKAAAVEQESTVKYGNELDRCHSNLDRHRPISKKMPSRTPVKLDVPIKHLYLCNNLAIHILV